MGRPSRLDGENDTLRMDGALLAEKADLSLSLWFRQAEAAAQPLLSIGGREPATQLLQLTVGGEAGPAVQVQYGTATRAVEAENGRPLTEGWHHLALVWQDRTLTPVCGWCPVWPKTRYYPPSPALHPRSCASAAPAGGRIPRFSAVCG